MIEQFTALGIEIKSNAVEQKTLCPKCSHTRKNKKDKCLSINTEKGVYNCHNCGFSGNVKLQPKEEYVIPDVHGVDLSERTIAYFKKRGISEATLANWGITESVEWFPQVEKRRKAINFNYYRDGQLVNVKFRDAEKNFKMVSGAELIFYGIDNIKDSTHCYIVEGEMDALSLHEAGIYSVVSVPNGASKGNQNLKYLDNCWQYFKDMESIVLFTDNDEAGMSLRNELARRLGRHRCKYVEISDFKDANDLLGMQGPEALRKCLKEAKNFPIEGVLNINDIWSSVLNYSEYGIKNYSLGLADSDDYFKIALGEWTVVTGIPNSGKSDVIDQIAVNMATMHDFKTAFFAPESFPFEGHIKRIANKLNESECDRDKLNRSKAFIEDHFHFVKIDLENLTLKAILGKFRELVLQKGINICVIDPYNMLDHSAQRDLNYVSKILSEITQFVQQTNTHLFLVAHPRKMELNTTGGFKVPTPYDISGSSDFFNKSFGCLTVYRELGHRTKYGSDAVTVHVQKVKRKENGRQGKFAIAPDFHNGGVYRHIDGGKGFTVVTDLPF